jgi:hypothetical protein
MAKVNSSTSKGRIVLASAFVAIQDAGIIII